MKSSASFASNHTFVWGSFHTSKEVRMMAHRELKWTPLVSAFPKMRLSAMSLSENFADGFGTSRDSTEKWLTRRCLCPIGSWNPYFLKYKSKTLWV